MRVPTNIRRNVRVTTIAENMLTATPIASVIANPRTNDAPNWSPNQNRIAHVMKVATFESRIEGHARRKPVSIAVASGRPRRSSSFIRSKMRMFASTAMPTERMNAAIPESVSVTGHILNTVSVMSA